jgi:RNA polymerase sigma-70 factor (ECF subfamily)
MLATISTPRSSGSADLLERPPVARLQSDSDRILIIRAASGDDRAFGVIVRRYTAMLDAVAYRVLGGTADIDDVVQETFLAAWTHADNVIDGDSIAGWLVTTVRRRCYDRLRTVAVRSRADLDDDLAASGDHGPHAVAHRRGLVAEAQRVLLMMTDVQRRCWELRQIDNLSYAAIGAEVMLPVTTVRGILVRARALMATELADWR